MKFSSKEPEGFNVPSQSGRGQIMLRCPSCKIAVASQYGGVKNPSRIVRVGTLDNPELLPPDAHIYVSTKQPWIVLDSKIPAFDEGYDTKQYWPEDARKRYFQLFGREAGWW